MLGGDTETEPEHPGPHGPRSLVLDCRSVGLPRGPCPAPPALSAAHVSGPVFAVDSPAPQVQRPGRGPLSDGHADVIAHTCLFISEARAQPSCPLRARSPRGSSVRGG